MTTETPAYYDWLDALAVRLNFRQNIGLTWDCGSPTDPFHHAKLAAADVSTPLPSLLAIASSKAHACCDCELLFNCDDRPEEEDEV